MFRGFGCADIDRKDTVGNPNNSEKTKFSHLVALQDKTQWLLNQWLLETNKKPNDYLFTGQRHNNLPITHSQYAYLVKQWAGFIGLNPEDYSTHSIRRTKAWLVYQKTKDIEIVRQLLGQKSISSTIHYLNIHGKEALAEGLKINI